MNRSYTANGLNQYTATGSITPTYDSRGNLISAGSTSYAYTSENRLATAGNIYLPYQADGRLWEIYSGSAGSIALLDHAGAQLITELNSAWTVSDRYVPGPSLDEPIVWYHGSGTSTRRWLHADERGSIVAVSDSAGAMFAINSYDEHGIPGAANAGRFQYTGQAWIPEIGMYYYRARMYSPTLGRFLQTDPIGYEAGMNLYGYVWNDPVNLTDPSGLTPQKDITITGSRPKRQDSSPTPNPNFTIAMNELLRFIQELTGDEPDIVVTALRRISRSATRGRGVAGASATIAIQGCPNGGMTRRMLVTAYDDSFQSTGRRPGDPLYGVTAHQTRTNYGTIAGPPNYPWGTMIYVPGYGIGKIVDRGGAIRGAHIDIWFPTHQQAQKWGNPTLDVEICR